MFPFTTERVVPSIRGKMFTSGPSWEVVTNDSGQGLTDEGVRLTKVKHVRIDGLERVYDLEVEDDHSFIGGWNYCSQ